MNLLIERSRNIWNSMRQSPTQLPTLLAIPPDHTDGRDKTSVLFQKNMHYFNVHLTEMYLKRKREWFDIYDPMTFVAAEFIYDTREEAVPCVVGGPTMMAKYGQQFPEGMIFSNTHVTGPHPYRGEDFSLALILYQVRRENYARKLLQLVGNTAGALDFAIPLSNYIKVANVVLDGIESLTGASDTQPLIGIRKVFNASNFKPGYFALIDMPDSQLDKQSFGVKNHQLIYGRNITEALPFREADFVLFSITQDTERDDDRLLPFYPKYQEIFKDAQKTSQRQWKVTKAKMADLALEMLSSPDLIFNHALKLVKQYKAEIQQTQDAVTDLVPRGTTKDAVSLEEEMILQEALSILDM